MPPTLPTAADRIRAFADELMAVRRPLAPAQAAAVAGRLTRLGTAAAFDRRFADAFAEAAVLVRRNHGDTGLTAEQAVELGGWLAGCAAQLADLPADLPADQAAGTAPAGEGAA